MQVESKRAGACLQKVTGVCWRGGVEGLRERSQRASVFGCEVSGAALKWVMPGEEQSVIQEDGDQEGSLEEMSNEQVDVPQTCETTQIYHRQERGCWPLPN